MKRPNIYATCSTPELINRADDLIARHTAAVAARKTAKAALEAARKQLAGVTAALETARETAREVQTETHGRFEAVVNECLKAVFDDPYTFKIEFELKRNKTEARIRFLHNGADIDPLGGASGGQAEVAAFGMQLAAVMFSDVDKVLILDEPFRNVARSRHHMIADLLTQLAERKGVQIIMTTHDRNLMTGKIIDL